MSQIEVSDLTFCYEGSYDNIFEHVSFRMDTDWRLGFIGRNGRGKTTFLRLLLGQYSYSGTIRSDRAFAYFPSPVTDPQTLTLTLLRELSGVTEEWRLLREIGKLSVSADALYRPYDTLSGGERTKVQLAALFLRENSFPLLDEPTNHLDAEGRAQTAAYLQRQRGFLLVSHDRAFLDGCVDHIVSINRADIEVQKGSFSSWYQNRQQQDAFEQEENDRLKKDIRRMEASARKSRDWADRVERTKIGSSPKAGERCIDSRAYIGEQSRRMQQRRKNLERRQNTALAEKSALLQNVEEAEALKLTPLAYHARRLCELRDVSLFYGEKRVCAGLSFSVERGERTALAGPNGCGKTTILKLLAGEALTYTGQVYRAPGLRISPVSQETGFLRGSVMDYAAGCGAELPLFLAILRKLNFERVQFEKPMEAYSEGQKKKVLLAASLCQQAHLYLWDEPLNYVDVLSRIQIEELLLTYRPTLLFVEHDRMFSDHIATRRICLGGAKREGVPE